MAEYLDQVARETNPESLKRYLEENRPGVARAIAASKNAPEVVLCSLFNHQSLMVRVLVARNLRTPPDILKVLSLDTEVAVRDSARFSLARKGRPKIKEAVVEKAEKPVEEVIATIKKEKKKNKKKDRNKNKEKKK
ncbi:MAG: hypothetical protein ACJAT2_002936 [Bacteriovoracaceae bacterium]|jgi:hypothetical protein